MEKFRRSYGKAAGFIGLAVNLILSAVKLYIGIMTTSLAVMADGLNNLGDTATGAATLAGFSLMEKNASKDFPYGYAKFEQILIILISLILAGVSAALFYNSLSRIVYFHIPVFFTWKYFIILACTVPCKLILAFVYRAFNRKVHSDVLTLGVADSVIDTAITLLTLSAYILSYYIRVPLDGIAGLLVSVCMLFLCGKIFRNAAVALIGESKAEKTLKKNILLFLEGYNEISAAAVRIVSDGNKKHTAYLSFTLSFKENAFTIQKELKEKISARFLLDVFIDCTIKD